MFTQKDYAQREDLQDKADPTRKSEKIYWISRIARSGRRRVDRKAERRREGAAEAKRG